MCVNFPLPRFCGVCGSRQRSLILDTVTGTITGFCCLGKKAEAPPLVKYDPRDYNELVLSDSDLELLADAGVRPDKGMSLLEVCIVMAVILTVAAIGVPLLLGALDAIKSMLALVNQVVVH